MKRRRLLLTRIVFFASTILFICSTDINKIDIAKSTDLKKSNSNGTGRYRNASALLNQLLTDYDIRLRPAFGGDALLLTMDIIIASFDSISEVDMDYTLTMYLHQYWRDERLSFQSDDFSEITLSGEFAQHIWVPDTFLANDKHSFLHEVTEQNKMLRISSDGKIAYGMRLTSTLSCSMDLHNFPLDSQNCTVEIESYGYTTSEVLMKWNQPLAVHGVEEADVPQFSIDRYQTLDRIVTTATGSYQRLSLVFQLKRAVGYFIFQTYLPCILIVALSWVSFWINHEATSARVALGITTVLTMTTISTGVRQSLPRISYVKSIDIYLVMCFFFVFMALLEYAAVNYNYWGRKSKRISEEGWPVLSGENKEDREGQINVRDFGVSSAFINGPSDPRAPDPEMATSQGGSPLEINECIVTHGKRASSPIAQLYTSTYENNNEMAEYPRYTKTSFELGARTRIASMPTRSCKARIRSKKGRIRGMSVKQTVSNIRKKAKKVIPTIKDINVIDQYSRIIFPLCFVIFNILYWGYYSLLVHRLS